MSMKECELLQIFRELMSCDFYVPEHHFDRQLKEERKERKLKQESYNIPLTVFWRPVETKDLNHDLGVIVIIVYRINIKDVS